ncbi:MAG: glucuronate isomerase [Verrucomicrobiae bacterium]|nr:glucuronate isomerase [Verrucomicrobiae bacterium]
MHTQVTEFRKTALASLIERVVWNTPVIDIHTHLYDPLMGELLLWGIDDLLVYHYLVAEVFRRVDLPYERFWSLSKTEQADLIWEQLFVKNSPISEACRGVLTTLHRLGLDPKQRDLAALRKWFAQWDAQRYTDRCLELAKVDKVFMTNSPFDDFERQTWDKDLERDDRFIAALRVDPILVNWPEAGRKLRQWGYDVSEGFSRRTISEIRRFLAEWSNKIKATYLMVSLPPGFSCHESSDCTVLMKEVVLPHCLEFGMPFALMLGVKRAVNPALQLAGDAVGPSDLSTVAHLCANYPQNRFLVTVLSRENQHELCVLARKFRNLHVFGCWWFTNVPVLVEEITRMRLELLGTSFTVQHSDARVLDQLIYKWDHTRKVLAKVLLDKYCDITAAGWEPTLADVERDVKQLLGGAFVDFVQKPF